MGLGQFLKDNVLPATAFTTIAAPIYQGMEIYAGMSDEVSLKARTIGALITYGGVGYLLDKGRKKSEGKLNIASYNSEMVQITHDSIYFGVTSIPISLFLYTAGGETNADIIMRGTLIGAGITGVLGIAMGGALDVAKDLVGKEECTRKWYPNWIKNASPLVKKSVAGVCVATSLSAMVGMYANSTDTFDFSKKELVSAYVQERTKHLEK